MRKGEKQWKCFNQKRTRHTNDSVGRCQKESAHGRKCENLARFQNVPEFDHQNKRERKKGRHHQNCLLPVWLLIFLKRSFFLFIFCFVFCRVLDFRLTIVMSLLCPAQSFDLRKVNEFMRGINIKEMRHRKCWVDTKVSCTYAGVDEISFVSCFARLRRRLSALVPNRAS